MKRFIFIITVSILYFPLFGQHIFDRYYDSLYTAAPALLTEQDEMYLMNVPSMKLTDAQRRFPLRDAVNNAETQYMTPIFYQSGNECGQASTICYTLSYELMRRRHQNNLWGFNYHYPSRFAWNFCNEGLNKGVNFMESWEVIRTAGTPNVNEWGGWYNYGEITRWISGYEVYHSAMRNRISEMRAIHIDSEEGLLTLKHWLNDHLSGDPVGGLANFYCTYMGNDFLSTLPEGTPEAGKHILTNFSSNVNHSKTIVGYNDSIRWDYNGDGLYTNHIDINGDGVVNLKDWEIGAVIFCNTFGTQFGDNGYCYLPYCKLASLPAQGGIWNSTVYVVQVKDEVYPQITYKATIQHTSRNKLKVTAGIARNTAATEPEKTMDFYIFNYQGGDYYMQGGSTEEDKTIEFGLDVSPLLNDIEPGQPTKFFFNVDENDPNGEDNGLIVNFSLMDYTSGSEVEQACSMTNVPITNNATTRLSVVRSINFTKPLITDTVIPTMHAFQSFEHQLHATGGKAPYRWEISREYAIEEINEGYPSETGLSVTLSNNSNGYATIPLGFDFPYYGDLYNQLVIFADGYIAFHYRSANWPFLQNSTLQSNTTRMICPFKTDLSNCQVRKIEDENSITLTFNASVHEQSSSSLQYAVKLYKDGKIDFYYGNMQYSSGTEFWSALCCGNGHDFQHTPLSGLPCASIAHRSLRMTPCALPDDFTLSESGVISGRPTHAFDDWTCGITCYDNNEVKTTQKIHLSSDYSSLLLVTDFTVSNDPQNIIFAGDTFQFTAIVKNLDTLIYQSGNLKISSIDPYISILDNEEYFGSINPGNEYTLNNCFTCVAAADVPNNHQAQFALTLENNIASNTDSLTFTIRANTLNVTGYRITDYGSNVNGMLDPVELDSLIFSFQNSGDFDLHNIDLKLRIPDSSIVIPVNAAHFDKINRQDEFIFPTLLYLTPNFVAGTTFNAYIDIYMNGHLSGTRIVTILGEIDCIDFSDNNIPEYFTPVAGQSPWHLDHNTYNTGGYSLRSGLIGDNDTTTVELTTTANIARNIHFSYKTSSETNYDWFSFLVDDILISRWSGNRNWANFAYDLPSGTHKLSWRYTKDSNQESGSDCAWIDDICIAMLDEHDCTIQINPSSVEVDLGISGFQGHTQQVTLENRSECLLTYSNKIIDNDGNDVEWVYVSPANDFLQPSDSGTITLTFYTHYCELTDYHANLITYLPTDSIITPITMLVHDNTGVAEHNVASAWSVYPNPTSGMLTISSPNNEEVYHACIYDIYGKLIRQEILKGAPYKINLQHLPNGVYILKMNNETEVNTFKIVKK